MLYDLFAKNSNHIYHSDTFYRILIFFFGVKIFKTDGVKVKFTMVTILCDIIVNFTVTIVFFDACLFHFR